MTKKSTLPSIQYLKNFFSHTITLFVLGFFLSCQWKDPLLKSLKNCIEPTGIGVVADAVDSRKYNFSIVTTASADIKTITWKIISGTVVLTQSAPGGSQIYSYTTSTGGNYTVTADIETVCGDKKMLSKSFSSKICSLPSGLGTPTVDPNDNTKIQVNLTGSTVDVASVTWEVKGTVTGNVAPTNITNNGVSAIIKLSSNDSYTITAIAKSTCGTTSAPISTTYTLQAISSNSSFKAWRSGGSGNDVGNSIALDGSGNVYVIGNYTSAITFGSTTLNVAGSNDVFIAKYNSNGDFAWVQRITGDGAEEGKGIAVDSNGDVYVIGQVSTNAGFFNTTSNVITNTPVRKQTNGPTDIFVAKYNRDGQLIWNKLYGGGSPDQGVGIGLHNSGIYITGFFSAPSATFGSTIIQASGIEGKYDAFVAKLNSNGDALWAVSCGGFENDFASSIAVDTDGNAYVTGNFSSPATFRSASGTSTTYTASATPDIFIAKYNSLGNLTAFHNSNSGAPAFGSSIVVNGSSVYVTGMIQSSSYGSTPVNYRGGGDILVGKFNANTLNPEWIKSAGGSGSDAGNGITVDKSGSIYVTGLVSDNSLFDNTSTKSTGGTDVFLAQYDNSGNLRFVKTSGGTGADGGTSIAINATGNLLMLTGFYSSSFVFGGSQALIYSGGLDMFIAKYPD